VRERFTTLVEATTERLIDELEPQGRAELRRGLAGPLSATVVAHALGLRGTDTTAVLGWYDEIVDSVTGVAAGKPVTHAGTEAFAALRSIRRWWPPPRAEPPASVAPRSCRTSPCSCSAASRRPRA
jgi:cytochrome P450